jgi:hypothetical protein
LRKRNCIFEVQYKLSRKFDSQILQLFFIVVSNQSTVQRCIVYSCNIKPIFVYTICQAVNMLRWILNGIISKGTRTLSWNNILFILHIVCRTCSRRVHNISVALKLLSTKKTYYLLKTLREECVIPVLGLKYLIFTCSHTFLMCVHWGDPSLLCLTYDGNTEI